MRFLRNRFIAKFTSVFFLLLIIESTVHSSVSYALTSGPTQPEYTSYEEPGSADMVNTLTGDFTFSLPILDVPGPDGGFSVPLTYNAGIGNDQEASWVGLGWTLNVGAITRSVVQYPDDASGEVQTVVRKDLDGERGWFSNISPIGECGWNTQVGHYGQLSILGIINASWDNNNTSVGIAGINVTSQGVSLDGAQFVMAAISIATMVGTGPVGQLALQEGVGVVIGSIVQGFSAGKEQMAGGDGYWEYSRVSKSGFLGLWTDYWIWLDKTRYEQMRGILNFQEAQLQPYVPTNYYGIPPVDLQLTVNGSGSQPIYQYAKNGYDQGVASDIIYYIPGDYKDSPSPVALGTDNYSVKAPGISGSIKPYRLDVSSVSMPREMSKYHTRLAFVPPYPYPNKVPFMYEGSNSGSYTYHLGGATSVSNPPNFYFGLSRSFSGNTVSYALNDVAFQTRVDNIAAPNNKVPMANHTEWLTNEEIASNGTGGFSSGFMDYFSGSERTQFRRNFSFGNNKYIVSSSSTLENGQIPVQQSELSYFSVNQSITLDVTAYTIPVGGDFDPNGPSESYVINTSVLSVVNGGTSGPWYLQVPVISNGSVNGKYCRISINVGGPKRPNSIGGYSITGPSGVTYHFSLPIYEYGNYNRTEKNTNPTTQYSEIKRDDPFASAWLLTGITGPDFIDRGGSGNVANGVIDENDWGYWIKFNYGKHDDDYQWRMPYSNTYSADASDNYRTYSTGHRQTYYLNSIESRTHVALFLKSGREDNRGANIGTGNLGTSLRLAEIVLISKQNYKKLFLSAGQGGFGIQDDSGLGRITKIWMYSDFFPSTGPNYAVSDFLLQNSLKRVKFSHTYDLCPGTDNSVAASPYNKGKLTLTRVSLIGRNDSKLVPDYKFEYGNNKTYGANSWDGWGMYSLSAGPYFNSHKASTENSDGSAWSLTKITNPLGSTIEVEYERDTYSSVSGTQLKKSVPHDFTLTGSQPADQINWYAIQVVDASTASQYAVGQEAYLTGALYYSCDPNYQPLTIPEGFKNYSGNFIVQSIVGNRIYLGNFRGSTTCTSTSPIVAKDVGTIQTDVSSKLGGNVRVASLKLIDQGKEFKSRYLYKLENGYSSGVVSREPEYIKDPAVVYEFDYLPGYPSTPVMYSKVTVLTGKLTDDTEYHTKQVYEFETPNASMISNNTAGSDLFYTNVKSVASGSRYYNAYVKTIRNEISDRTSKLGKLKSITLYDKNNTIVSSSSMIYDDGSIATKNYTTGMNENKYQGIYTESTLMFDKIGVAGGATSGNTLYDYHKMARSTYIKYPYELKKVINTKDGFTTQAENRALDFYSGQVVEKVQTTASGSKIKTIIVPAYAKYSEMGSKAGNIQNKNMLTQDGATYNYQLASDGAVLGLLSGEVQTWNKSWSYRNLNTSQTGYEDPVVINDVWRIQKSYVYKGTYSDLRSDGTLTFSSANEFNFSNPESNPKWQHVSEITRYDHYSATLEGKDFKSSYSSSKKDITQQQVYASSSNASYNEFAFSGAEDWGVSGTGIFLGGEVGKGNSSAVYKTPSGSESHTGQVAILLSGGNKGFIYKPSSLKDNRMYRASVWTNSLNGSIYYILNGQAEQIILPVSSKKVGDWYQINVEIPVTTFTSMEVGVKSTSGTVSFDDFRFQPRDAAVSAQVYDPVTGAVTFSLDNQNMFTRYEYNDRGQLVKTYSESFAYGVKLISESKSNYKRFTVNP